MSLTITPAGDMPLLGRTWLLESLRLLKTLKPLMFSSNSQAIAVIKTGDKKNGKQLLLDIIKNERHNSRH